MKRPKKQNRKWRLLLLLFCIIIIAIAILRSREDIRSGEIKRAGTAASISTQVQKVKEQLPEILAPHYLENLSAVDAGTVLQADRIDESHLSSYFTAQEIDEQILQQINGKSYQENKNITLSDLRCLKVLHYNYNHEIQAGELIVNARIAEDCLHIFEELFAQGYEINSMYLVDRFWTGDGVDSDTNSIENNNTSAFNYRVVPGSGKLSNHAKGLAIDLNPLQNPYVKYNSDGSFAKYYKDMEKYTDRSSGEAHMITHEDPAYQIFTRYGFTWGGDWKKTKDYQHFERP